jgi:hypothetical protein
MGGRGDLATSCPYEKPAGKDQTGPDGGPRTSDPIATNQKAAGSSPAERAPQSPCLSVVRPFARHPVSGWSRRLTGKWQEKCPVQRAKLMSSESGGSRVRFPWAHGDRRARFVKLGPSLIPPHAHIGLERCDPAVAHLRPAAPTHVHPMACRR